VLAKPIISTALRTHYTSAIRMIWLRPSSSIRSSLIRFSTRPHSFRTSDYTFLVLQVIACACFSTVSSSFALARPYVSTPRRPSEALNMSGGDNPSTKPDDGDVKALAKEIEAYNSAISAAVTLSNAHVIQHSNAQMLLRVTRTVEDIDNDKKRDYEYTLSIPTSNKDSSVFFPPVPPTEVHPNIQIQIPSPSGNKIAKIRADENNKKDGSPARQVLEVWDVLTSSLIHRIALPTNQEHGKVISDAVTFGKPSWSTDEKVLVYAAERKAPETTSFFDSQNFQAESGSKKIPGGKATLGLGKSEGWGEQYREQEPLLDLFLVNVETGRIQKVHNVPGMFSEQGDSSSLGSYSIGQPIFSPDGKSLVYTAWDAGGGPDMAKRLGMVYCQQRACKIYASSITSVLNFIARPMEYPVKKDSPTRDSDYVCLTPNLRLAKSPRFSPPKPDSSCSLIFIGSEKGFDTHFGHIGLYSMDWRKDEMAGMTERVVVKQRWDLRDPAASHEEGTVESISFPGLALVGSLPEYPFVSTDTMVTSTMWGSSIQLVRINLLDGSVRQLRTQVKGSDCKTSEELTSQELLCTTPNGGIVVKETSPNNPGQVVYIPPEEILKENVLEEGVAAFTLPSFSPMSASTCAPVPGSAEPLCGYSYQTFTLERPTGDNKWSTPIQCILMLPSKNENDSRPPPMIVLPHGGPHSLSTASYLPEMGGFLCGHAGYALLMVNYRGSVGFSQAGVEDLPSRIGDLDVKDVVHSVDHVVKMGLVDSKRLAICGGSHGGFLTGHCLGQYPDLFKAACMRNPVTNIASMITSTDIPDWCVIETCGLGTYDWSEFTGPSADQLAEMYSKSPIAHVKNVKTPTLIALGAKDLRVPPCQGLEYYHILRRNVPTKLLLYDDCDHPIGAVGSKADNWINIKRWFDDHVL